MRKNRIGKSGEKYITWQNKTKCWRVAIPTVYDASKYIGKFKILYSAIICRDKALSEFDETVDYN